MLLPYEWWVCRMAVLGLQCPLTQPAVFWLLEATTACSLIVGLVLVPRGGAGGYSWQLHKELGGHGDKTRMSSCLSVRMQPLTGRTSIEWGLLWSLKLLPTPQSIASGPGPHGLKHQASSCHHRHDNPLPGNLSALLFPLPGLEKDRDRKYGEE